MWSAIGWLGNACFFGRFLLQWRAAERAGRVVTPTAFWWLSLAGAVCLLGYTMSRGEAVLFAGAAINGAIYARNIYWGRAGQAAKGLGRRLTLCLAATCLVALVAGAWLQQLGREHDASLVGGWLLVVLVGQSLWSSRFLIQWIDLEARRKSHLPPAFWWVSLAGNLSLLSYALHRRDPVLIAGYALGPIVQIRNLVLGKRDEKSPARA